MIPFIHDDLLLKSPLARRLYHSVAADLPIVDFHNHLSPRELADDITAETITRLWITNDPYKHRAMRIAGVPERLITGDATDRAKFDAWAATLPLTLGNPLFLWSALELARFFNISTPLNPESADEVWHSCNEQLQSAEFTARALIRRSNVEILCTSDSLDDDLAHHRKLAESPFPTRVLPSLRIDDPETVAPSRFTGRLSHFSALGCRLADHSVERFDSAALRNLTAEYARHGWILQLHIGARRDTSTRLRALAGPAGGYATIGQACDIAALCGFLNDLERASALPRTVLFPLNPADFAPLATLTGSFSEDHVPGKIQLGPPWWFNDHPLGIRAHLDALSSYGLLHTFVGMTTDSRSLLSMVRHETFRRVLCDWLGDQVAAGAMPADDALLAPLVRAVCHGNARSLFTDTCAPGATSP